MGQRGPIDLRGNAGDSDHDRLAAGGVRRRSIGRPLGGPVFKCGVGVSGSAQWRRPADGDPLLRRAQSTSHFVAMARLTRTNPDARISSSIRVRMSRLAALAVVLTVAAGCFSGYSDSAPPPSNDLRVHRGPFAQDLTISGELEAARGEVLSVPRLPQWQSTIKWIVDDGTIVKAGDPVVELDNSSFTSDLDQKRQAETQAVQELQQREAEWTADLEQKQLDAEKAQSELEKAELNAAIPKDVLSLRKYEEYQTGLARAR